MSFPTRRSQEARWRRVRGCSSMSSESVSSLMHSSSFPARSAARPALAFWKASTFSQPGILRAPVASGGGGGVAVAAGAAAGGGGDASWAASAGFSLAGAVLLTSWSASAHCVFIIGVIPRSGSFAFGSAPSAVAKSFFASSAFPDCEAIIPRMT